MTQFTALVHGHGLVDWTVGDVDRYADTLRAEHSPHRNWMPGRAPTCRSCGYVWPCAAYQWCEQWLASTTRLEASHL